MREKYIISVKKQFAYYKLLGDKTIDQLSDIELFNQINNSNSIGMIVKHLWGNMLSRWTDFCTTDGEKSWRDRDAEFQPTIKTRKELLKYWEEGWTCLFDALKKIEITDLDKIVYIRNQGHTVVEAINRQLCHYSYHIGQMVFLGKLIKGDNWISLSIANGKSSEYNHHHFRKPKSNKHFTDDIT